MDLIVLGGVGLIGSEVVKDLSATSNFSRIIIADQDLGKAEKFINELQDDRLDARPIDVNDREKLVELISKYPVVCNCLPFKFDTYITECCYKAGVNGIDLGATKDQLEMDGQLQEKQLSFVVCCGITPGVSNVIVSHAAEQCDYLEEAHVYFASFRAIATAPGLVRTTLWEIDPNESDRMYYENGTYHRVPPFAGAKEVAFPDPIGLQETYYVPHNEVYTIPRSFPSIKKVSVRGTWTPKTRRFLRFLYDYGFFNIPDVNIEDSTVEPMHFIENFVFQNKDLEKEDLWGFALIVDVKGYRDGRPVNYRFYTRHPSMEEWGVPGAYVKNTALPMSVGTQLLAGGIEGKGILTPDQAFNSSTFLDELKKRGLQVKVREDRDVV